LFRTRLPSITILFMGVFSVLKSVRECRLNRHRVRSQLLPKFPAFSSIFPGCQKRIKFYLVCVERVLPVGASDLSLLVPLSFCGSTTCWPLAVVSVSAKIHQPVETYCYQSDANAILRMGRLLNYTRQQGKVLGKTST